MALRVIFGVFGLAGAVGMVIAASRIALREIATLRYTHRLDEWAEEVEPWQL